MARRADRTPRLALLLPLLALAAPAQPPPSNPPATGEEIVASLAPELAERLQQEKVVMLQEFDEEQAYGGMIHALVLFERPRNEVIRLLIQSPRQKEFRPELREARLVQEFEGGQVVHYEIRMMLMTVEYRSRHTWNFETGEVWWSLDPDYDNDLAALEGHWEVFSLGPERSVARFGTRIDVGALPGFLQDYASRRKLPEAMHNVRKWIDSGGTFRP